MAPEPPDAVVSLLLAKLREQVERTVHLLDLVPPDALGWAPAVQGAPFPLGRLIGHLLECLAGFCAVLQRAQPERLAHFAVLRDRAVDHDCGVLEARRRIDEYLAHVEEGFGILSDDDLRRTVATVFVPEGEAIATLLLGNLEHLINHKFQLFYYLKMMGVPVGTADLYRFRSDAPPRP